MVSQDTEKEKIASAIAHALRRCRELRSLKRSELSKISGVSLSTICKLETSKMMPSIVLLTRLADALCVDIFELFLYDRRDLPEEEILIARLYWLTKGLDNRSIGLLCDLAESILERRDR